MTNHEYPLEIHAFAQFKSIAPNLEDIDWDGLNLIEYDGEEWLICDEQEREQLWEEALDSYIDECIVPELPVSMASYFDCEKWKRDARFDGAGVSLAHYDHEEHEILISNKRFYLYRQN